MKYFSIFISHGRVNFFQRAASIYGSIYEMDLTDTYFCRSRVPYKTVLRLSENSRALLPWFGDLIRTTFPLSHSYSSDR